MAKLSTTMPIASTQKMAEAVSLAKEQVRQLGPMWRQAVLIIAVAFVLFHVYTAGYQLFFNVIQRSIHIGFAMTLGLLLFPPRKKGRTIAFASSLMGFLVMKLRSWERVILLASAVLMFIPGWLTGIPGTILLVGVYLRQRFESKHVS